MDPALPSSNPTTLRAFDMVVAISEDALNKQLEYLYHLPVNPLPLPVPGTTPPVKEYLIAHEVHMHYPERKADNSFKKVDDKGNPIPSKAGIDGWIAPPAIKIHPYKENMCTVSLKFIKNPDDNRVEDDNSYYSYYSDGDLEKININGWSVSWESKLSATDIQDTMEDVVFQRALPPDTAEVINKYVRDESFLVSSIFCLMESNRIVNSFDVVDQNGESKIMGAWANSFILAIRDWLGLDNKKVDPVTGKPRFPPGVPTQNNPFVLGYGIRQKAPTTPGAPIPVFAPLFFQFTTSAPEPTETKAPGSCTLNFCMKTKDKTPIDLSKDGMAGLFKPSLMERVGHSPDEVDGVMVVSNGLLYEEVLEKFFIKEFHKVNFHGYVQNNPDREYWDNNELSPQQGPALGHYRDFKKGIGRWGPRNAMMTNMAVQRKDMWFVWENFQCDVNSDPAPNPFRLDAPRRMFVTVRAQHMLHWRVESSPRGSSNWSDASNAFSWINLKFRYMLEPKADGSWIVKLLKEESHVPETEGEEGAKKIKWKDHEPKSWPDVLHNNPGRDSPVDNYEYGTFSWGDRQGFFAVSGNTGLAESTAVMMSWAEPDVKEIERAMNQVTADLNSKIIMPAGNVFSFKGLNTDGVGNVYSGITYNTLTNGEKFVPEAHKRP